MTKYLLLALFLITSGCVVGIGGKTTAERTIRGSTDGSFPSPDGRRWTCLVTNEPVKYFENRPDLHEGICFEVHK